MAFRIIRKSPLPPAVTAKQESTSQTQCQKKKKKVKEKTPFVVLRTNTYSRLRKRVGSRNLEQKNEMMEEKIVKEKERERESGGADGWKYSLLNYSSRLESGDREMDWGWRGLLLGLRER